MILFGVATTTITLELQEGRIMDSAEQVLKKLRLSYAKELLKSVPDENRLKQLEFAINNFSPEPGMLTMMTC